MTDTTSGGGAAKADYTFGQIAIRENICTFEQVKECLDIQAKLRTLGIEPKKLGEILIEKGYLSPEQAVQLAKAQVQSMTSSAKLNVPGYELISRIGQGAMGTVYKAKQVSMDRVVAIKVLSPRYSKDRTFVERFLREARAVAKLNHENIISGIDVGESNGHHYFVMEFVDGAPVTSLMKRDGRIDEQRCLRIGVQVARALAHAHKHGIVHRDIKPENIMLTASGNAKLCDLGLAKQTKDSAEVTMDGTSVGTPNYISPEQARGEDRIDIRSDLYSLGASLYHMAVGGPPFFGANPMVVMTKHVTEYAEPPKKRCPALSEGFSNMIMKLMQKRREDRHQDPEALIQDLERLLNGEPLSAAAPAPVRAQTSVPRPATHYPSRPPTSVILPPAKKGSTGVVTGIVLTVVAIIGAVLIFSKMSEEPPAVVQPTQPKNNQPQPPVSVDAGERVRRDLQAFRELVDSQISLTTKPDRYTEPYATILQQIEKAKRLSDFNAQRSWQEELGSYTAKVNTLISSRIWAPIKAKADEQFNLSHYPKAQEELSRLEDVYKYFRNDDKVEKTQAGKEHEAYLKKIADVLVEAYNASRQDADRNFRDPKKRDEAYLVLDAAAESATPEQKDSIDRAREDFLKQDLADVTRGLSGSEAAKKTSDRIAQLRTLVARTPSAVQYLDRMSEQIKKDMSSAATAAVSQAMSLYTSFRPAFDDALKRRDVIAARKSLFDLYFSSPAGFQSYYLPASTDNAPLKNFLDPTRATTADTRKVVAMAEEGIKFTALRASSYEAARELYVDLRILALLEELLEQSAMGASIVSRDTNRFKTGYSAVLKDATLAELAPRKPGEAPTLAVTVGTAKSQIPLAPAGKAALPEDDIVALAKRSPSAASDAQFALKAFYLYVFADRLREAKDWLDKLASAESRIGTERYTDRFKGMSSGREEEEAKKAFQDAYDLYIKKKDSAGGAKKFKEILERYSGTEYMKTKVPPYNKTRLDLLQEQFGSGEGKPKGMRPNMKDLFAGADVKDAGRGRTEVTWSGFRDDKDLALFSVADGQVNVQRVPGGVAMQGTGMVQFNGPLKGNVTIEVSFRPMGDGGFGLFLHAEGNRSGYLAVADLPIPNATPLDAIFRLPVKEGAAVQTQVVAQGGTGIQLQKGAPNVAAFAREGAKLRFTLNRGELAGDSPTNNEGHLGVALLNNGIIIDRIKITGEIDSAWLDAELKKVEGR